MGTVPKLITEGNHFLSWMKAFRLTLGLGKVRVSVACQDSLICRIFGLALTLTLIELAPIRIHQSNAETFGLRCPLG